jgi:hypothetical protein
MAERRRYTKSQKMAAVIAAEFTTPQAAAEGLDIPQSNVYYWFNAPEFVELRKKTREDMAEETAALAHKVLGVITAKLPDYEPKDLNTLYGILVDKSQLLTGQATSRTEARDITATLDDHERETLRKVLDEAMAVDADL